MTTDRPVPTILTVLAQRVADRPGQLFLRFRDEDLTYAAFDRRVRSLAGGLRRGRVAAASGGTGSLRVLPTLLPNCADGIALWFAANRVGAVWAPLNTEFRGEGLAHAINLTGARDLVVDRSLLEPVLELGGQLTHVRRLFLRGGPETGNGAVPAPADAALELLSLDELVAEDDAEPPHRPAAAAEASLLIYTSGTTGLSKACELSHHYVVGQATLMSRSMEMRESDVTFCPYPIFHFDSAIATVAASLLTGATAVIAERFSVSRFWHDVRHFGATTFDFMGATLTFLYKQDPRPDDADNPVRLGWGVPMPAFKADFERRFGLALVEGYGSTEGGVMVYQKPGETYPAGSCGRCVPEYRLRIVDEDDHPLPPGEIGEIVVRPTMDADRHLMMTGYYGMPEANAAAFRKGWFHTGDLGRLDDAGNLYFEGRSKDAIRRRGENISAREIEQVIESHPAVLEVAAYGVPSEYTEEEVAVAVVRKAGHALSAEELLEFCRGRMARYMVPEHVRFLDTLPKTPTEKVAKRALKDGHPDRGASAPA